MKAGVKVFAVCFPGFMLWGCVMQVPEVPKADLTISSISPVEFSSVNQNSTLQVTYSWRIENYDISKRYMLQILLYDTNTGSAYSAVSFDLYAASGASTNAYSGGTFYNCIFSCVRKAALPFRVYFTIERLDKPDTQFGTTLARTREYIYN